MSKPEQLPPDEEDLMESVINETNPEDLEDAKRKLRGKPEDSIEKQVKWEMEETKKLSDEIIKKREHVRENKLRIALGENPKLQGGEGKELVGEILEGINKSDASTRAERVTEIENWASSAGTGAKKKLEKIFNSWEQSDKARAEHVTAPGVSTETKISYWEKIYNDKMAGEDMRKSALKRLEELRKSSESEEIPEGKATRKEINTPGEQSNETQPERTNTFPGAQKRGFLKRFFGQK